VYSDLVKRQM